MKAILNDLGMRAKINLRCDAKAARALAQRQGLSKRTRHVKVKFLFVQDLAAQIKKATAVVFFFKKKKIMIS